MEISRLEFLLLNSSTPNCVTIDNYATLSINNNNHDIKSSPIETSMKQNKHQRNNNTSVELEIIDLTASTDNDDHN